MRECRPVELAPPLMAALALSCPFLRAHDRRLHCFDYRRAFLLSRSMSAGVVVRFFKPVGSALRCWRISSGLRCASVAVSNSSGWSMI